MWVVESQIHQQYLCKQAAVTGLKRKLKPSYVAILHGHKLSVKHYFYVVVSILRLVLEWYTHMLWSTLNEPFSYVFDVMLVCT